MEKDDAQLIHDILSGNDSAFSILVQKYQKSIHAFAWQKIGDFHHAQEITQDIFLRAYQELSTLRNPNLFVGWLYVIANRFCIDWLRKQKPTMQSLDDTRTMDIVEKLSYTNYISEQRQTEANEHNYEIVQNLLKKLPERERTVVTLHYLGEMTTKEISTLLEVSVNTIHSWLHRARKRLQREAFLKTPAGKDAIRQSTEELILNILPKMLKPIQEKIYAKFQTQLGKSIPDTQMGMEMIKQTSEKMASDIGEKIRTELQKQLGKEFPKK